MTLRYELRSASLIGFEAEVLALGGELPPLLSEAGLTLAQLRDGDFLLGSHQVIYLLASAAERLGCPDLGMRVAGHQGIEMLGLLGHLLCAEPDLAAAFAAAQRYMALHNKAEHWRLQHHGARVYVQRIEHFYGAEQAQQYREMAVAACARLARQICGNDEVRPLRVEFSHSPLATEKTYRQHFGCEVLFNQEHDCLIFDANVMTLAVKPLSAMAQARIDDYVRDLLANLHDSLEMQVRTLITQTLGLHQHSLEHIAGLLGLHPRTLQRRLREENLRFKQVVLEVKMQLASWHLHASAMDLTRLADALGYNDLAAFSRAFKNHHGLAPSRWREQHQGSLRPPT
ncbi:MAG: AraC family transcriptional regulator ligand-binding domain-containing protein [Pseudomonas sp.]